MVEWLALVVQHGHLWQALEYVSELDVGVSNFGLSMGLRTYGEHAGSVPIPWR